MALALLANVQKRVISILNANPGAFLATVSGEVGAFPTDAEILAAILEADEFVATRGYFQSVNQNLARDFLVTSDNLTNGDSLPFFHGNYRNIEVSQNGTDGWSKAVKAASLDDVLNAIAVGGAYVGAGVFDHLFYEDAGNFYFPAPFARIEYAKYTRTSILQCQQNEETLIICTAIRFLVKNASPAPFQNYIAESNNGIQQLIQDGVYQQGAGVTNA